MCVQMFFALLIAFIAWAKFPEEIRGGLTVGGFYFVVFFLRISFFPFSNCKDLRNVQVG